MFAVENPVVQLPPEVTIHDRSRFEKQNRARLSGPGFRTFLQIAEHWGLGVNERLLVLGSPAASTYHKWAQQARNGERLVLPADTLLRISFILGIHKALAILAGSETDMIDWLKRPNTGPAFGGQTPLSLICDGSQEGMALVRRYLDAWRGGIFAAPNRADSDAAETGPEDVVFL